MALADDDRMWSTYAKLFVFALVLHIAVTFFMPLNMPAEYLPKKIFLLITLPPLLTLGTILYTSKQVKKGKLPISSFWKGMVAAIAVNVAITLFMIPSWQPAFFALF